MSSLISLPKAMKNVPGAENIPLDRVQIVFKQLNLHVLSLWIRFDYADKLFFLANL